MLPEILLQILYGCGISIALFFVSWLFAVRYKNAAVADIIWALGFLALAGFYLYLNASHGERQLILLAMVAVWSLRMGLYLLVRTIVHIDQEDRRYTKLKEESNLPEPLYMLWIFFCQAVLQAAVTVPFVIVATDSGSSVVSFHYVALAIFIPAFLLQSLADYQLASFKSRSTETGAVCNTGLWRYSRHPNYFFEWLIWISFAVFALASPGAPFALVSPLIMLQMLLNVSGVKISEEVSVKSRGEAYRRYQKETSAFIPWFPRRS